jgi:EAL domain-containing protein (putative c-di-GMP-specific phosphodiesterase class I)
MCAGVEDEISAKILEELQPDFIQGYYYSKPLPLDSLVAFLIEHNK